MTKTTIGVSSIHLNVWASLTVYGLTGKKIAEFLTSQIPSFVTAISSTDGTADAFSQVRLWFLCISFIGSATVNLSNWVTNISC